MHDFEHDLGMLLEHREHASVSIYLPLERQPEHRQENTIRWKNLQRRAAEMLSAAGDGPRLLKTIARLVHPLLRNPAGAAACAILHGRGRTHLYHLPVRVSPLAVVGDRFHIKPLLHVMDRLCRYHLLVMGRSHLRLYRGTQSDLEELPLPPGAPRCVEEVLLDKDREKHIQGHSASACGRSPIIHGQGLGERREERDVYRYLQTLDQVLERALADDDASLVVSGDAKLVGAFTSFTRLGSRIDLQLRGSFGHASRDQLLRLVVPALFERRRERHAAALSNLGALARTGKLSHRLADVVHAADEGRVQTLFVTRGVRCWGQYHPTTGVLRRERARTPSSEDLLDLAAVRTLQHGGRVLLADPGMIPGGAPAVAVMRHNLASL